MCPAASVKSNYITIVPLHFNLTYPPGVQDLQDCLGDAFAIEK